jgi:hypothetical protein
VDHHQDPEVDVRPRRRENFARSPTRRESAEKKKKAPRERPDANVVFSVFSEPFADLLSFFSRREQKTSRLFAGARNAGGTTPCSSPSTRV